MNINKALDINDISAKHYAHVTAANRKHCKSMIQGAWETEQIDPNWGKTLAVHIPKPGGGLTAPDEFRPINLVSVIAKINPRSIAARMSRTASTLTQSAQHGFKPRLGCERAVGAINRFLQDSGPKAIVAFLDLKKAFDVISQNKLYSILVRWGYPGKLINVARNPHSTATLIPKRRSVQGKEVSQKRGVWRISALSPILFILHVEGMMTELGRVLQKRPRKPRAYAPAANRYAGRFPRDTLEIVEEALTTPTQTRSLMHADDAALLAKDLLDSVNAERMPRHLREARIGDV